MPVKDGAVLSMEMVMRDVGSLPASDSGQA